MTTTATSQAKPHPLWLAFADMDAYRGNPPPIMVRGEGAYLWDEHGRRYLDGLGGLFNTQVGHGRTELAEAGAKQAATLASFHLFSYAHRPALELAERLSAMTPGDPFVFFTTGGGEGIDSAWKLAKRYFAVQGKPTKVKMLSRLGAYHGSGHGALSITAVPNIRTPFAPLLQETPFLPNTNVYRSATPDDPIAVGKAAAQGVRDVLEREGPETVAAIVVEPIQNSGGCIPPPPGYLAELREICDTYDVLMVMDEVVCGFGRLGENFGSHRVGAEPDIMVCAKGLTSGYAPMGALLISQRVMEPLQGPGTGFAHGYTYSGHPVGAAVALANLDIIEREDLCGRVRANTDAFRAALEPLMELPVVGDIRGDGYLFAVELVKDSATRTWFDDAERAALQAPVGRKLLEHGLHARLDDRAGSLCVQLCPALVCGPEEFNEMGRILYEVLDSWPWPR